MIRCALAAPYIRGDDRSTKYEWLDVHWVLCALLDVTQLWFSAHQSCIVHLVFIQAHVLDAWVSSSSVQCAVHPVYIYWFVLSAWVSSSTVQCIQCTPNRVYICDSMCIRCTMHRAGCIVHSYYNEAGCTVSGQDHICREWYFRMAVACQERIAYPVIVSGIFGWL